MFIAFVYNFLFYCLARSPNNLLIGISNSICYKLAINTKKRSRRFYIYEN